MSLIGSLEQFDLANILRRIEVFSKTGLLVVKQGALWVEFYFRQGQLVCIGPVRANTSLIDRLVQAKLLSLQTLPQIRALLGSSESNETRIALTLINEGYLSREVLRAWASHETSLILQTILSWPTGEVYFEDDCPTPADRLLIALSATTLLDTLIASAPRPAGMSAPSTNEPAFLPPTQSLPVTPMNNPAPMESARQLDATQLIEKLPSSAIPGTLNASQLLEQAPAFNSAAPAGDGDAAGLFSASQLIEDFPFGAPDAAPFVEEAPLPSFASANPASEVFGSELNISASNQVSFLPPQPVANPLPPARIDTSFMTPELVLVPVDLSSLRERNPQVQLTPDQWRLLALIDGQSSVQMLCQALMASLDQLRGVAGELLAIGLVMPQPTGPLAELPSPAPNGMTNGMMGMAPSGQYAAAQPVWPPQSAGPAPFTPPIATQAQWGNGNNGAPFVVDGGWMVSGKQPVVQPGYSQPAAYAPVGGYR